MNITFYEPPMCCPTGVCGPSVDGKMVTLVEQIAELEGKFEELSVERFMISTHPKEFKANEAVFKLVKEQGKNVLPITSINNEIIKTGEYPTMQEMLDQLNK